MRHLFFMTLFSFFYVCAASTQVSLSMLQAAQHSICMLAILNEEKKIIKHKKLACKRTRAKLKNYEKEPHNMAAVFAKHTY